MSRSIEELVDRINTVTPLEEAYPVLLRQINDPPKILYYIGDISLASQICVSAVGSRKATPYGKWAAFSIGEKLGQNGVVSVSGMAQGIDSFVHKGSLKARGRTIAVLGNGPDICFPSGNIDLMRRIADEGLILSEYAPGVRPTKFTFPLRNRIISGLSAATIVVEAGLHSGSLITAERASEQGREVYAIPGNINNINAIGGNKLIKDGASPLIVLDDILDDMGLERKAGTRLNVELGKDESIVLELIKSGGEVTCDEICRALSRHPGEVSGIVTVLEMKGCVYSALGKIFVAK